MSELKFRNDHNGTEVSGKMEWRSLHDTATDKWVAICDDLRLTVQADTQRELHDEIWDSMETLFALLIEENRVEQFLAEHGWIRQRGVIEKVADFFDAVPVNILSGRELAGTVA